MIHKPASNRKFGPFFRLEYRERVPRIMREFVIFFLMLAILCLFLSWVSRYFQPEPVEQPKTPEAVTSTVAPDPCELADVYCDGEPVPVSGKASWLVYELPDTCATRDWPKGTHLLVQSENGRVKCVVRDFGPSEAIYPERIVDLNLEQFSFLADPRRGVIDVTVTPQ